MGIGASVTRKGLYMADDPTKKKGDGKRKSIDSADDPLRADKGGHPSSMPSYNDVFKFLEKSGSSVSSIFPVSVGPSRISDATLANHDTIQKIHELEEEKVGLRREADNFAKEAQRAKTSDAEKEKAIRQYIAKIEQISEKERLSFLLSRVNEKAQKLLLESVEFQKSFLETHQCNAFVMSVDIRRSTELMSKARSPQQFANFMTILCTELERIIKENYGVFDKFTGDGVLAFFPDFYSGDDAGIFAVSVADQCHKIFEEKYREFRNSFISVLTGVGLGIGIDYGPSHLVQMAGGLTIVGTPVVYACRMSGATANTTLLNQYAYEKISERFSPYCSFQETEIEIKNEGKTLAYQVQLNEIEYTPSPPPWLTVDRSINMENA
jgi:class 3 adenylate cyclase